MCTDDTHKAIKADPARFSALPLVDYQSTYADAGEPQYLEMRNCTVCHSTLAVPVMEISHA